MLAKGDKQRIISVLKEVRNIKHTNILKYIHFKFKRKQLIVITELITAGSIREYYPLLIINKIGTSKRSSCPSK